MQRCMAVLVYKALNLFKSSDDAFLSRGAAGLLLRLGEVVEFRTQLIEVEVSHSGPHL